MLGNKFTDDLLDGTKLEAMDETDDALVQKEENLRTVIDDCKKMLIIEPNECLGGWGLISCDHLGVAGAGDGDPADDPSQLDMDIILLLSQAAYYIAK